jgi:FkbM family methyltransferase
LLFNKTVTHSKLKKVEFFEIESIFIILKEFLIDIISIPDKNIHIYTNKIIETVAIGSIVISEKIDKISFMKIDLEGAEVLVLNGAIETLKQMRIDTMITEFHSHGDYIRLSNSWKS